MEKEGITDGAVKTSGPAPTAAATTVRRTSASRADDVSAATMVPEGTLDPDTHAPTFHTAFQFISTERSCLIEVFGCIARTDYDTLLGKGFVGALVLIAE